MYVPNSLSNISKSGLVTILVTIFPSLYVYFTEYCVTPALGCQDKIILLTALFPKTMILSSALRLIGGSFKSIKFVITGIVKACPSSINSY